MELWNEKGVESLEDRIGKFIDLEEGFHLKFDRKVVKILVKTDLGKGLSEELEIR
jgi:hypothetical protein